MTRIIHCTKLNKDCEGLDYAPYPGPLGERIYAEISKEAWQQWLQHQTMIINEYRLNMLDPNHRKRLSDEMIKYLFDGDVEKPAGYVPPK